MAADSSIAIHLDKDAFFGGDLLTGTVVVAVVEPFTCRDLSVTLVGREAVCWRDRAENNGVVERVHEYDTIIQTVVVAEFNGEILAGEHSYPFMIELPEDLAGQLSFPNHRGRAFTHSTGNLKASLEYQIRATLLATDLAAPRLVAPAEQNVNIHQRHSQKLKPSHDSIHRRVSFLYCIDRGVCQVMVSLDKAVYSPGDTAIIHIQVKNDSLADVTSLRCRVHQDVVVRTGKNRTHSTEQVVAWYELAGVPAGVAATYHQEIVLLAKDDQLLNPSMRSTLIECSYRLEVESDIPWNPDFVLHLPMTLVAPSDQRQSGVIVHGTAFLEAF